MPLVRYLPRFRQAYRALGDLQSRENWPRQQLEAFQLERLNAAWAEALIHVPYYRRLATDWKLPRRFDSLAEYSERVPLLPKPVVRANCQEFLSEKPAAGFWRRTSGSTGSPMSVYWSKAAHLETLRARYRFYSQWGADIFDRTVYLWGNADLMTPGLKGRAVRTLRPVLDRLRNRLRLSVYRLGKIDLRDDLRRIERFRPASLYGFSSALYLLAQEALERGFACPSLKVVIMTAEPAYPQFVEAIQKAFGVPAVIEYGSTECGFLAGQAPDGTLRVREDLVYLETIARGDGRYDVVNTILTNPSFPLFRYAIEDVTEGPLERPDRGFAILQNISGRNNDLVLTRNGRPIHSSHFEAIFKQPHLGIRRYRVHQQNCGRLDVLLEIDPAAAEIARGELQKTLSELTDGYSVQIELIDELPTTASGKHRFVVSDLARQQSPQAQLSVPQASEA